MATTSLRTSLVQSGSTLITWCWVIAGLMKDNLVFTSSIFTPNLRSVIRTYLMGRLTRGTSCALFPLSRDFQLSPSPVCLFQSPPGIFAPEKILKKNEKVIAELKTKFTTRMRKCEGRKENNVMRSRGTRGE